jgi:hypothetical protein
MFRLFPGPTPGKMICHIAAYMLQGTASDQYRTEAEPPRNENTSDVTLEDYRIATEGYANLVNAPAAFKVVFGRNEIALQAMHRSFAEALGVSI